MNPDTKDLLEAGAAIAGILGFAGGAIMLVIKVVKHFRVRRLGDGQHLDKPESQLSSSQVQTVSKGAVAIQAGRDISTGSVSSVRMDENHDEK